KTGTAMVVLILLGVFAAGALVAHHESAEKQAQKQDDPKPQAKAARDQSEPKKGERILTDRFGDPLPVGAVGRLGTVRLRHGDDINGVAFSPNGKTLASTSLDRTVRLWDMSTGKELLRFLGHHNGEPRAVAFSPDGKTVASAAVPGDWSIRLWDAATGKELVRIYDDGGWFGQVVFSPDGKTLASGCHGHQVKIWDVATGKLIHCCNKGEKGTFGVPVAYSPDGKMLASGGNDGTIRLFDVQSGKEIRSF